MLIKRILERKGHAVSVFTEEEEAWRTFQEQAGPGHPGHQAQKVERGEVLEEIKKRTPATKVIMLTGIRPWKRPGSPCAWGPATIASSPSTRTNWSEKWRALENG
jgi:DNA-binding NtrC family response regulator